jgi:hypothetical protein
MMVGSGIRNLGHMESGRLDQGQIGGMSLSARGQITPRED